MSEPTTRADSEASIQARLEDRLALLRSASRDRGTPSYDDRMDALQTLLEGVLARQEDFAQAISADFGGRPREETRLLEIFPLVTEIRHARDHLDEWMADRSVSTSWQFRPAKSKIVYQPLGVVGILSAWNYPLYLSLSPMVGALAAGNRVLLKPSEYGPRSAELLQDMISDLFSADHVQVVTGDADTAKAFSSLPFDHLLFTGSTRVGKLVMQAASENLTPVTLELGGKSPTIVHEDYPIEKAARRIWTGKLYNAGQTCLAPDYLLLPPDRVADFVRASRKIVPKMYKKLVDNRKYTRMIHADHWRHIDGLVEDARTKGAEVVQLNPRDESFDDENQVFPPTLVLDPDDSMTVLQEEIFGPVLPIVTYGSLDEAIRYVQDRPRPLALYYFDRDGDRIDRIVRETLSGGVTVNDVIYHIAQPDLPFGGVGHSGMGHYHGRDGFETFSHKRSILRQRRFAPTSLVRPPFGRIARGLIRFLIGK